MAGAVPERGPGPRRRAGRGAAPAVLGPAGRLRRDRGLGQRLVLHRARGPAWWGTSWAERLTESPFGDRAVEHGLATRQDLARLAEAWRRWAASEDGWFFIPHGEILCEVPA